MLVCLRTKNTKQSSSCWKASSISAVSPQPHSLHISALIHAFPLASDLDQQAFAIMVLMKTPIHHNIQQLK